MQFFLQVLGAIFLLLIVMVVVAALVIRAKLRAFMKRLEEMASAGMTNPGFNTLRPVNAADWEDASPMRALGVTELSPDAAEELDDSLRMQFLEESKISAAEWERVRDDVVIIHDKMTQELFDEAVSPWLEVGKPPDVGEEPGERPREVFARLNEQLPPHDQFQRLGKVSTPIEADVYAAPGA